MVRKNLLRIGCFILWTFWLAGCSGSAPQKTDYAEKPTLSVWGFSCELGGKNCKKRSLSRKMQKLTIEGMERTQQFQMINESSANRKHLSDIADMLWSSGESSILQDIVQVVQSDYLVYGRVFEYNPDERILKIELTLTNCMNGDKLSKIGEGSKGSLAAAIIDATNQINEDLEDFLPH